MSTPLRILILRRKAVGDLVVSMAVPRAIKQAWPMAKITLVADRGPHAIAEASPWVDDLLIYEARKQRSQNALGKLRGAKEWMQRLRDLNADLCLDLMGTPQTAQWSFASRAARRIGPRRRWRSWAYTEAIPVLDHGRFAGDVFLDVIRPLGLEVPAWSPVEIPLSLAEREIGERTMGELYPERPRVVLIPSATWPAKAWPLAHYIETARGLQSRGLGPVGVAWGPGEEPLRDAIIEGAGTSAFALPASGLRELAAQLAAADLVLSGDCGPKHLAVAMGTPTISVYGSTDPDGWHYDAPSHRALVHDVPCRPCNQTICHVPGHPCMQKLQPARMVEAALTALQRRRP